VASESTRFKVGLFLIVGFLLLAGALLWLGATRVWKEYRTYVTYFAESVQGLDVGSPVKFRGVPLGRVSAIRVAPDGEHVEVRLEINPTFRVRPGMRARLGTVGITGAAFVDLELLDSPKPQLPFSPPPDYIPSAPSFLTHLASDVAGLVGDLRSADLPGLATDLRRLVNGSGIPQAARQAAAAAAALGRAADRLEGVLASPRVDRILAGTEQTVGAWKRAAGRVDALLDDPALPQTMADLSEAARQVRLTAQALQEQVAALDLKARLGRLETRLAGATDRMGRAADQVAAAARTAEDDAGRTAAAALRALARIEAAAGRLETVARDLGEDPSRIVWETPLEEDLP